MPAVASLLGLGCLFPVSCYQYTAHILLSPCPKKNKGSPPLLKTLRVCFKWTFKTCHCEGKRQNTSFSKHSAPSFLTFLLIGTFLLVFFSSALVRKELLFSVKPETGALGFVLPWCRPRTFTASGPRFTFPLFQTTWFSTILDNLLQLQSMPSPPRTALAPLLLHHLTILCSPLPSALLVCLLHPSIYIGKNVCC